MKGGTVKSNKKKTTFQGKTPGASFGSSLGNGGGGWQGGMGKKSILSSLKKSGNAPTQQKGE
jgi:hypothetical protein